MAQRLRCSAQSRRFGHRLKPPPALAHVGRFLERVMAYRVGLPGWKFLARRGFPVTLRVQIMRDQESGVYIARSPDLDGLVVEATSLDVLRTEALGAADVLLELALHADHPPRANADFRLVEGAHCAA